MKDLFMTVVAALVSINLLYSVTALEAVTKELKMIEIAEMMRNPDHSEDVLIANYEYNFSDEELTEVLGL